MAVHEFTLVLNGVDPNLPFEVADALYEAGCDDASLGASECRVTLSFHREASTLLEAVLSAIRSVESAGVGVAVESVSAGAQEDLVNAAEIARRIGRTRESVRLLINASRGPGGFPPSIAVSPVRKIWRWADVAKWALDAGIIEDLPSDLVSGRALAMINNALDLRRFGRDEPENLQGVVELVISGRP